MNLISRKTALRLHRTLLLGFLLLTRPAIVWGNDIPKGRELYLEHCAACHGVNADGHGPLEHELTAPQPTCVC